MNVDYPHTVVILGLAMLTSVPFTLAWLFVAARGLRRPRGSLLVEAVIMSFAAAPCLLIVQACAGEALARGTSILPLASSQMGDWTALGFVLLVTAGARAWWAAPREAFA